jgi:hypothetical protein
VNRKWIKAIGSGQGRPALLVSSLASPACHSSLSFRVNPITWFHLERALRQDLIRPLMPPCSCILPYPRNSEGEGTRESATTKTWHKGPGPLLNTRTFHYQIVSRWSFHSFSPAFSLFNITREAHDQQKLQIFINTVFRYHSIIWRRRTVLKYTQNPVEIAHGTDRICRKDYG